VDFTEEDALVFQDNLKELGFQELTTEEKYSVQRMLSTGLMQKILGNMYHVMRVTMWSSSDLNIVSSKEDTEKFLRAQGRVSGLEAAVSLLISYAIVEVAEEEEEESDG
jgi:hypothetical protein